ncbi:MAG: apolipoprotein N-acyltransferase [Acidimicrobiales bacterium]
MRHPRAASALAGLLIAAGLPPWGWWPLTLAGLGLWFHLLADVPARTRLGRSVAVGAFWAFPSTLWMLDLTPAGWPVAAGLFTLLVALAGWATPGEGARRPTAFAGAVVLAEVVRWHVPFGGVPLATLAMASVDTPWAVAARFLGSPFLVFVTVVIAAGLRDAVVRRHVPWRPIGAVCAAVLLGYLGGIGVDTVRTIDVVVVQGGGPQNTRADTCENRNVFERHVAATELIAADEDVDLILWPEDVIHPVDELIPTPTRCDEPVLRADEALGELRRLAAATDATIVSGWFEPSDDRTANENYSVVTTPDGRQGDRYDKVRLVPFGEFVPLRSLLEKFSDELPGRDVRAGTGPAVLDTEFGPLGVSISWEIFFDYRARDAMNNGGQMLLNPTNGSSYWLTIVQTQQVASSRLRAIENDRWVLQAAPTGFSAVVGNDGEVHQRTSISEQTVLRQAVPLRQGRTLATIVGPWPMLALALFALGRARRGSDLDGEGDGPVVDELDGHVGTEATGRHGRAERP